MYTMIATPAPRMNLRSPDHRLTRTNGSRELGVLVGKSNRTLVANQQRSLALIAVRSMRRLNSSKSSMSMMRDSVSSLDSDVLHFLCKEAAELLGYDTSECDERNNFETSLRNSDKETLLPETILEESDEDSVDSFRQIAPESSEDSNDIQMIEYQDGVYLPLYGCDATKRAIREGNVTVTTCSCCQEEMTCIDNVDFAVCPDCWTYSPIEAGAPMDPINEDSSQKTLGLGVKGDMLRLIAASISDQ